MTASIIRHGDVIFWRGVTEEWETRKKKENFKSDFTEDLNHRMIRLS